MPWRQSWQSGWEAEALSALNADPLNMIFGQVVFEIKELAFQFAKRGQRLGVRIDNDVAVASVDNQDVSGFD